MSAILDKVVKGIPLTTKETTLMNTDDMPTYVYFAKDK